MEQPQSCSTCGTQNPEASIYCSQCGKALRTPPVSTAIGKQIFMYVVSALFTPLGLGWAFKYLRQQDPLAKKIGIAIVIITIISLIINLWVLFGLYNSYFQALNQLTDMGL